MKHERHVTIYDVAKDLGVSHTTVSAVMSGRAAKARIGAATAARVQAAAKRLGYQRNALAHAVVSGRTRLIGMIIRQPESELVGNILHGALSQAESAGYVIHLQSMLKDTEADFDSVIKRCLTYRPAGVYLCHLDWPSSAEHPALSRLRQPIVHTHCGPGMPGTSFDSDEFQGMSLAVGHLLSLGHRRIAFLGGRPGQRSAEERRVGFLRAMADAGLECRPPWIEHGDWLWDASAAAARRLLASGERPSAIVCANDSIVVMTMQVAAELGLRVPADLSLVGCSDQDVGQCVRPQPTTIAQAHRDLGRLAIAALLDLAEGLVQSEQLADVRLPGTLKVRGTTAASPC